MTPTVRILQRSLAPALIVALAACGGADEAAPDAGAPDASVFDAGPDAWSGNCPLDDFTLDAITCWSADFATSQRLDGFVAAAPASRLRYQELADGACQLVIRFEGPGCTEEQRWTPTGETDPQGRQVVTSDGITACTPAACGFGAGDDACVVGARAGTALLAISVVLDVGDEYLDFEGAAGSCADAGFPIESQFWRVPGR